MMMMSDKKKFWLLFTFGCVLVIAVQGFMIVPQTQQQQQARTSTSLFGRKRKGLGNIVADGGLTTATTTKKATPSIKQRSKRTKKGGGKSTSNKKSSKEAPGGGISPDLANWLSSQEGGNDDNNIELDGDVADIEDDEEDTAVSFQTFEAAEEEETPKAAKPSTNKQNNNRRIKQSERKEIEAKRAARVSECIDSLEKSLEESGNIDGILTSVQSLIQLPSESLRVLIAGKKRLNYRLAWVGSDDAITHIGTGLHKVPLARLQEVFMCFLGRNRMEVSEVIRILGPFPNVRNILQGNTKIMNNNASENITTMNVVVDSMVDGTGKEILAGTDENVRNVDWHVYFADERAIVAVVPPKDGSGFRSNPLEDNGANVLVFVKEDELDKKLDSLRVN